MAAQPGWKVDLMALGLALVTAGCFFGIWELGRLALKAFVFHPCSATARAAEEQRRQPRLIVERALRPPRHFPWVPL